MKEKKYQLKNYLSVQNIGDVLYIGSMPPVGRIIEEIPEYLVKLLSFVQVAHTEDTIVEYISNETKFSLTDSKQIFDDLLDNKIIGEAYYDRNDRYSRHSLYYDLIDIPNSKEAQKILSEKTVGLVGMGGIGSNVAMNLAAAGVGTIVFSDGDKIESSNLTRQFLYREEHIGEFKVDVAAKKLKELNSSTHYIPICESVSSLDFFYRNEELRNCDFIVISADSPMYIHDWINEASINLGFAYSNAGYIEKFGAVGPLVIPGETACYECYKYEEQFDKDKIDQQENELNKLFQAPSYGPLNSMVAAIQSNEVIRFLLSGTNKTKGTRLLIDSENYKIYEESFERRKDCELCSILVDSRDTSETKKKEESLFEIYSSTEPNLNRTVLNPLMKKIIPIKVGSTALEIGAATGELGSYLKKHGVLVDFNDISNEMLEKIPDSLNSEKFVGNFLEVDFDKKYDLVLCNNVLDYVADLSFALSKLKNLLKENGSLYLTIPHPVKDTGFWNKEKYNGRWNYNDYILNGYFSEGKVHKQRENSSGEVVNTDVSSYHRTISTYIQNIRKSGFFIQDVHEASPSKELEEEYPILYEKSSNIPYFLTFVLTQK